MQRPAVSKALYNRSQNPRPRIAQRGGSKQRGRFRADNHRGILRKKTLSMDGATVLRRRAEEKLARYPAVTVHEVHQKGKPVNLRSHAKSCKVGRRFFPGPTAVYAVQSVKLPQGGVATAKPLDDGYQPAGNQPWRHQAFWIHRLGCAIKALLPRLPTLHPQKQRPDHRTYRVLKVWDQLDGQQREGLTTLTAYKARYRYPLLLELRKQLDRITPVGRNLSITILTAADRTACPNAGDKIDLIQKK